MLNTRIKYNKPTNIEDIAKRTQGQYFTQYNQFKNNAFKEWAKESRILNSTILEPFAGSNNLIRMIQEIKL